MSAPTKLTPAQRAEARSLIEDSGYSRTEALAWVRAFVSPVQPNGPGRVGKAPR